MAVTQGWVEVVAVGSALAIGTAYSSPPLRLKRYPALAAASISLVRAFVVNLGVYLHFASSLGGLPEVSAIPPPIVALTLFVLPFSFAIAVFKDVPDAEGDRRFRIGTFTVRLGARAAFRMGMAALVAGTWAWRSRASTGGRRLGWVCRGPLLCFLAPARRARPRPPVPLHPLLSCGYGVFFASTCGAAAGRGSMTRSNRRRPAI